MSLPDGGPAFPGRRRPLDARAIEYRVGVPPPPPLPDDVFSGMSLRDYFAAAALQGWAAGRNNAAEFEVPRGQKTPDVVAACYRYADAMLKERAKT